MYLTNFKMVIYLTNFKWVMYLTNSKLVIQMTNFKLVKNCNQYRIGQNNQYLTGYVRLTNSLIGYDYQFKLVTTNKNWSF